ncbi:MAG: DUF2147 domain-containing protein [Deltaproteobacteria bacterium]|nr:DUF2147 domain-containing protein [Deltaproteobacteria bacterium]
MKKTLGIMVLVFLWTVTSALAAETPIGKWKTIDDETNKEISVIEIYEQDGALYGRIVELLQEPDGGKGKLCDKCTGNDYNKPIVGMVILKGLKASGNEFSGGTIMDPGNGKTYKCKIEVLEEGAKLKVRVFVGFSLLGRNQYWLRVQQ